MRRCLVLFLLLCLPAAQAVVQAGEPSPPLRMVMDVRSNHSDGAHDFATLVALAEKRGADVLAFTEHDRFSIRLGLDPIPGIVGYQMQHPSLYTTGVEAFFDDLAAMRRSHPEILLMAGTESTPGYRWRGLPFRDLTLHNPERHIIALGVEKAAQVRALPSFDLRHAHGPFVLSLAFWCLLVGSVLFVLLRRRKRAVALLLFASFLAFLATWLTRGELDADTDFIQTAKSQGLFTVWAHPHTNSGTRPGPMGVMLDTPPYDMRVFREPTADAFAAFYGDTNTYIEPGKAWDRYLAEYMTGLHAAPIWAVSAGDYHGEGQSGEYLGNFPMDVWAESRTPAAVLAALRHGHMAAWRENRKQNYQLARLTLEDGSGKRLLPGDEARVSGDLSITMLLRALPVSGRVASAARTFRVRLIVDGEVHSTMVAEIGDEMRRNLRLAPGPHVVRVDIPNQWPGAMVANPFLLHVSE